MSYYVLYCTSSLPLSLASGPGFSLPQMSLTWGPGAPSFLTGIRWQSRLRAPYRALCWRAFRVAKSKNGAILPSVKTANTCNVVLMKPEEIRYTSTLNNVSQPEQRGNNQQNVLHIPSLPPGVHGPMCTRNQLRRRLLAAIRRRHKFLRKRGMQVHERILQSVLRVSRTLALPSTNSLNRLSLSL
jgi:hypothetical protein